MKRFTTTFACALAALAFAGAFCGCGIFQRSTDPQQGLDNFVMYYRSELDMKPRTLAENQKRTYRVEVNKAKGAILTIDEKSGKIVDNVALFEEYEVTLSRPVRYGPNGKLLSSEPVRVTIRDAETNLSRSFAIE